MVLAILNVEMRSWGSVVFVPLALLIGYVFVTQPIWTFIVGAAMLAVVGVAVYYLGVRVDQRLRHGGGS